MELLYGCVMLVCYILGMATFAFLQAKILDKEKESSERELWYVADEELEEEETNKIPLDKQMEALLSYEGPGGLRL